MMEVLNLRFEHLSEKIYANLDDKSLSKCKEVSRPWYTYISNLKCFQIRLIQGILKPFQVNEQEWSKVLLNANSKTIWDIKESVLQFLQTKNQDFYCFLAPLHVFAAIGNMNLLDTFYKKAVNKLPKDNFGCTPLYYAAKYNQINICQFIISNEANINDFDLWGPFDGSSRLTKFTPLYIAAQNGHQEVFELLIRKTFSDKIPGHYDSANILAEIVVTYSK